MGKRTFSNNVSDIPPLLGFSRLKKFKKKAKTRKKLEAMKAEAESPSIDSDTLMADMNNTVRGTQTDSTDESLDECTNTILPPTTK